MPPHRRGSRAYPLACLIAGTIIAPSAAYGASPAPQQFNAATLPGNDAGAQINAADARFGTAAGTILYQAISPAKATTPVTLRANHTLILASPIAWTSTIKLPEGSSGQAISCPAPQTLAYPTARTWIDATRTSQVTFHDCRLVSLLATVENVAIGGAAMRNLAVTNNDVQDTQLVSTFSSASRYSDVTPENSSSAITVTGNHGGSTSGRGTFVQLTYTNQANVSSNTANNYFYGVYWWGGDSCVGGGCSAGGNGAATNPRLTSFFTISHNQIMATQACIWGSMGRSLQISDNTCTSSKPGTGDVGIDLEGTQDSSVTGNKVQGFRNGSLATFFLATRNVWSGNTVDNAANEAPIGIHNSTQDPGTLSETFLNNTFQCAVPCATIIEATGTLTMTENHLTNVFFTTGFNVSKVILERNIFTENRAIGGAVNVSSITSSGPTLGTAVIRGNQIISNAVQPTGIAAISVTGTDFNRPQETLIDSNSLGGSHPFPVDIECKAESGNSPAQGNSCTLTHNTLAAKKILTSAKPNTAVHVTQSDNH